jgi:hypothetical protein
MPSMSPEGYVDAIPEDHEFVCLTFGPTVFGAEEGRPAHRLHNASIHFQSPVAVGDHWREWLGSITFDKLQSTRLAIVASEAYEDGTTRASSNETLAAYEDRAYNALRALLIQGNPFESHVAGLEIRRLFDAGRFREEAAFMRPRTSHPWERISLIDDGVLAIATAIAARLEIIRAQPDQFARLVRGLDHWDQATMEHRVDLRLHTLVRALEALIAPKRGETQRNFVSRCKVMMQAPNADQTLNEIYELRSQVEHSNDWRLAFQQTRPSLSHEDAELLAMLRALQVEQIVRRAYLRVLSDPKFLESFRTDELIRGFWASPDRDRTWGDPTDLESEIRRAFDPHKAEIFERVTKIDLA